MTLRGKEQISDWIETALLVRGPRPLGLDPLYEYFEKLVGLEPQLVNIGISEMVRRAAHLGDFYPFKVHGEYAIQALESARTSTYMAITLMAPAGPMRAYVNAAPDDVMPVVFENIVVDATSRLWGDAGEGLRFGWPSEIGRPPEFNLAIEWLAQKIGVGVGQGYRQPRRKDGGVDVVAWRPFPDGRSGFPVLLVQCTLQENLLAKGMDVDTRLWSSWLAMDFDPATALATPAALPPDPTWDELTLKHLVLDRIRLAGLATAELADEIALDWVQEALAHLEEHMGEIGEL